MTTARNKLWIKKEEDGTGPYRWFPIVKRKDGNLYKGTIYEKEPSAINDEDAHWAEVCASLNNYRTYRETPVET